MNSTSKDNKIYGEYDNSKIKIFFHNGGGNEIIFKEKLKVNNLIINCFVNNS